MNIPKTRTGNAPYDLQKIVQQATCLYTRSQVENALDQMADQMNEALSGTYPIFIGVMIGGLIPLGHLLPRLTIALEVDYVHATRYGQSLKGGELHWQAKPHCDFNERTVVVVDDILDGGNTLQAIVNFCYQTGAKKVYTSVLVNKKREREKGGLKQVDFSGLMVDDHYVFGYGLDYKGYLRNASGIYQLNPQPI